jgi:RHS repeat-associated protein
VDESGIEENSLTFASYGERCRGVRPNYGYTGKEEDPSGLSYFGARYYDTELARWVSKDPKYLADTNERISEPLARNLYAYGMNNPERFVDPDGLDPVDQELPRELGKRMYLNMTPNERERQRKDEMLNCSTRAARVLRMLGHKSSSSMNGWDMFKRLTGETRDNPWEMPRFTLKKESFFMNVRPGGLRRGAWQPERRVELLRKYTEFVRSFPEGTIFQFEFEHGTGHTGVAVKQGGRLWEVRTRHHREEGYYEPSGKNLSMSLGFDLRHTEGFQFGLVRVGRFVDPTDSQSEITSTR